MPQAGSTSNNSALTLDRGLRVLKYLAAEDGERTVSAIAHHLGLHRQVIYRLVGTLEAHGLAVKGPSGGYRLGAGTIAFAGGWISRLERHVRPVLLELAETCSATSFLMGREGDEAVALVVVEPSNTTFHLSFRAGSRHPLRRGAGGIALLAGEPEDGDGHAEEEAVHGTGAVVSKGQVNPGALGVAAKVRLPGVPSPFSVGVITMLEEADVDSLAEAVSTAVRRVEGSDG